jgi:N,N'-diacetyllegionaminate synthase
MEGPDHLASMEPLSFTKMVKEIRNIEIALGQSLKKPTDSELKNISRVRKSIVASKYIAIGDEFNDQNITTKRPGGGISPMMWDQLIGKKASIEYQPDDFIKE